MLILIEGPDSTGKTTLARRLREEHGFAVLHKGPPRDGADPFTEYLSPLAGYSPGVRAMALALDRGYWDEMVYPHAVGREGIMGPSEFGYIDAAMARLGCVAVSCDTGDLGILRRWREDGEHSYWDQVTLDKIREGYTSVLELTSLDVLQADLFAGDDAVERTALEAVELATAAGNRAAGRLRAA